MLFPVPSLAEDSVVAANDVDRSAYSIEKSICTFIMDIVVFVVHSRLVLYDRIKVFLEERSNRGRWSVGPRSSLFLFILAFLLSGSRSFSNIMTARRY